MEILLNIDMMTNNVNKFQVFKYKILYVKLQFLEIYFNMNKKPVKILIQRQIQ